MMGRVNPWLSMWTQPRHTVRSLLQIHPKYGVFPLAAIYALQSLLYFANYWSLGISFRFYAILITAIVASPIVGAIWLYVSSWVFYCTGRWLSGKASAPQLRVAVAWSKIPTSINLLMWVALLIAHSDYVFILDAGGPSSLFINFITLILGVWSLVLLIQSIREVQYFSIARALVNVFLEWIFSSLLFFIAFAIFRYFYILTF